MDECPPPFVVPPPGDDDEGVASPFDASFSSVVDGLDALQLPSVSRSPSPSPVPKSNGVVHHDEKENDFDQPPPITIDMIKDASLASPGGGGIESFLEREAIRKSDLPVDCIGLGTPTPSRDPSPCPEKRSSAEEAIANGVDHAAAPIDNPPVDQPAEIIDPPTTASGQDEEDDDDDFGDFGFAAPPPALQAQPGVPERKDLTTVTEEDDDWAAFQSGSTSSERKESVVSAAAAAAGGCEESEDDWAAFEAAAPAADRQPSLDDDDDWATDFASAPPPPPAAAAAALPEISLPSLAELSIDEGIWSGADGDEEEEGNDCGYAFDLYERLDAEDPTGAAKSGGARGEESELLISASLWLALRVVEEAAALRHTWEGSTTARQLHDLLGINTARPAQRAAAAAAAAISPDAVLQPTRLGEINGKSARAVTFNASQSSISHVSSSSSSSYSSTGAAAASTSLSSGCLVPSSSSQSLSSSAARSSAAAAAAAGAAAAAAALAPPAAEFDWEKSALKTPAMQHSGAMLDMDYLAAGGGGAPPKIISSDVTLQRDLDAFGLSATSASAGMPRVESTPSVLDTILRSSAAAAAAAPRYLQPAELSLDARALHDALPSLDHLAAAWISFPLRDNGDC